MLKLDDEIKHGRYNFTMKLNDIADLVCVLCGSPSLALANRYNIKSAIISGVARGGVWGVQTPPIEKCQRKSEDKIVENTQS